MGRRVRADPLAETLGVELGSHGRIPVGRALQLSRHPEVFAVVDLAEIPAGDQALPMLAQVAIQSGRHAARSITAQISGHQVRPFHYRDLGTMATIAGNDAVAQIGPLRLSGFAGWLAWLLVHIVRTVGLQTRASVVISWISGYLFADRPARLITGPRRDSPEARPAPPAPSGGRSPEGTVSPGQVEESRTRPA